MSTPYLDDKQLAERFGKTAATIRHLCKNQGWPHMRVGSSYRFTEAHIAAIEALCEVKPEPKTAEQTWGVKTRGGKS